MEKDQCRKYLFSVSDKKIAVYPSPAPDRPIVYLNTFAEEGEQVYQSLCRSNCPAFTLVAISGLSWHHDMTPWEIPPVSENDTPCTGGADEYLRLLTEEIVPNAEEHVTGQIPWRALAGYSLAGLFALYSLYRTDLFPRAASMSGSLWFPGFREYVLAHEMAASPERIYLSLGDRECRTGNPYLKTVQAHTEEISAFYVKKGIDTKFQLNPGGHFKNAVQRTAAGIAWILELSPEG